MDICCREGLYFYLFHYYFFLPRTLWCLFHSEDLLIYVFIPFCLDYKGSVCPSSLYISLSCCILSPLARRDLQLQPAPNPQNASKIVASFTLLPYGQSLFSTESFKILFLSLTPLFELVWDFFFFPRLFLARPQTRRWSCWTVERENANNAAMLQCDGCLKSQSVASVCALFACIFLAHTVINA